jgi:hypothetical protein
VDGDAEEEEEKMKIYIALISSLAVTGIAAMVIAATQPKVHWQALVFCFLSSFGSVLLVQGGRR